ncbi:MAG: hypothetical protein OXI43_10155 [Candidatus Poribacteria bacterium]|nr:hypothetical protein [Candidatus Poribacteria bacterium]
MKRAIAVVCVALVLVVAGFGLGVVVEKHNHKQRQIDNCLDILTGEGVGEDTYLKTTWELVRLLKE